MNNKDNLVTEEISYFKNLINELYSKINILQVQYEQLNEYFKQITTKNEPKISDKENKNKKNNNKNNLKKIKSPIESKKDKEKMTQSSILDYINPSKIEVGQKKNLDNISPYSKKIPKKNNEPKNESKTEKKNFNETLFDYKKYYLLNIKPQKRKNDSNGEDKEMNKSKDTIIEKKKKMWITKDDEEFGLSKGKNIKIVEEEKKEDELESFSELNLFNQMFKKSQDDFNVNNNKIKNKNNFNIKRYKNYLKNESSSKENHKVINKNTENDIKLLEDIYLKAKDK